MVRESDLTLCTVIRTPATDGFNQHAVINWFCSYLLFNFYPWWLSLVKDRKLKNTNAEIQIHMEHKKDNPTHFLKNFLYDIYRLYLTDPNIYTAHQDVSGSTKTSVK